MTCITHVPLPTNCAHQPTHAPAVRVLHEPCADGGLLLLLLAHDSNGVPVCSGGDHFHLDAVEARGRMRFAALSEQPAAMRAIASPHVYFINVSAATRLLLPSVGGEANNTFNLTLHLVETPERAASATAATPPSCAWRRVPLPQAQLHVPAAPPLIQRAQVCSGSGLAPAGSAYMRLASASPTPRLIDTAECGQWCHGNASRRLVDTSNAARFRTRRQLGFSHILASATCRMRLYSARAVGACLEKRSVLLVSSTFDVALLRGVALLNRSFGGLLQPTSALAHSPTCSTRPLCSFSPCSFTHLLRTASNSGRPPPPFVSLVRLYIASWTRTKPGPVHPNVADFWRAFEKPSGSYCYKRGQCALSLGGSQVAHLSFHYPEGRGMANLKPMHIKRMCAADVLVFESGGTCSRGTPSPSPHRHHARKGLRPLSDPIHSPPCTERYSHSHTPATCLNDRACFESLA